MNENKRQTSEPWVTVDGYCAKRVLSDDGRVTAYKVWPTRQPNLAETVPVVRNHVNAVDVYLSRRGLKRGRKGVALETGAVFWRVKRHFSGLQDLSSSA